MWQATPKAGSVRIYTMEMQENTYRNVPTDLLYRTIIRKLNATIAKFRQVGEISQCQASFDVLEEATYSHDSQVNHLLAITNCLLKYMPYSPYLDELFTNFLKDYIHLVNPEMPRHPGPFYLDDDFVQRQKNKEARHPDPYSRRT